MKAKHLIPVPLIFALLLPYTPVICDAEPIMLSTSAAETGTYGPLTYKINGSDRISVVGCDASAEHVTIPATIDGIPVVSISMSAFHGNRNLLSISIPDGVTSIGSDAFAGCSNLNSIELPETLVSIGQSAFGDCKRLEQITLPDSLQVLRSYAFKDCVSLTSITIPGGVTEIESDTFSGCSRLASVTIEDGVETIRGSAFSMTLIGELTIPASVTTVSTYYGFGFCHEFQNIYVDSDNPNYTSVGGVLYTKDQKELVLFPRGRTGEYHVPEGTESLAEYAFSMAEVEAVVLPSTLQTLGNAVFYSTDIQSIILPPQIVVIPARAFMYTDLHAIEIPASVTRIAADAFYSLYEEGIDVYYVGSQADWETIEIGESNTKLENATMHFNSSMPTSAITQLDPREYLNVEKVSADFDLDIRIAPPDYYLDGEADNRQVIMDGAGHIYVILSHTSTVALVSRDQKQELVQYSNPGYIFGAATMDEQGQVYILWTKLLNDKSVDEDNIRICVYDTAGTLLDTYLLSSEKTYAAEPLYHGNANLACRNGKLAVVYTTKWKNGHQGAGWYVFDTATKDIIASEWLASSHAYDVRMVTTAEGFATLQLGDGNPRGILFQRIHDNTVSEEVAFHCNGSYGENGNLIYTTTGGVAECTSTFAVAGTSERIYTSSNYADYRTDSYNVFVRILAKDKNEALPLAGEERVDIQTGDIAEQNVVWLTNYDNNTKVENVNIIALSGDRFCVLWNRLTKYYALECICFTILDQYGNILEPEQHIYGTELPRSTAQPVVYEDVLTWINVDNVKQIADFYSVDFGSEAVHDINLDRKFTVADVILLQKWLLAAPDTKLPNRRAADVNEDGVINVFDLALLKRKLLTSRYNTPSSAKQ